MENVKSMGCATTTLQLFVLLFLLRTYRKVKQKSQEVKFCISGVLFQLFNASEIAKYIPTFILMNGEMVSTKPITITTANCIVAQKLFISISRIEKKNYNTFCTYGWRKIILY